MDLEITNYQFGQKPTVNRPDPEFLNAMGEQGIREMVSRFYDLLRQSSIKQLFKEDDTEFEQSKQHSSDFMIQILGGPEYYNQHRGKPKLTKRHAPFSITVEGRIVWLSCFREVLLTLDTPEYLTTSFWNYLNFFSTWMVNTNPENPVYHYNT
jgi:hemoglobin